MIRLAIAVSVVAILMVISLVILHRANVRQKQRDARLNDAVLRHLAALEKQRTSVLDAVFGADDDRPPR